MTPPTAPVDNSPTMLLSLVPQRGAAKSSGGVGTSGFLLGAGIAALAAVTVLIMTRAVVPHGETASIAAVATLCFVAAAVFGVRRFLDRRFRELAANQAAVEERLRQMQAYLSSMWVEVSARFEQLPDWMDDYADRVTAEAVADAAIAHYAEESATGTYGQATGYASVTHLRPPPKQR